MTPHRNETPPAPVDDETRPGHDDGASGVTYEAQMVNRWLLSALAAAWRRYPSMIELPDHETGDARALAGKVVDRLARDGLVQLSGDSLALSEAGYAAVDRAGRSDGRLSDLLHAGTLPGSAIASSLVLVVLRSHFDLYVTRLGGERNREIAGH